MMKSSISLKLQGPPAFLPQQSAGGAHRQHVSFLPLNRAALRGQQLLPPSQASTSNTSESSAVEEFFVPGSEAEAREKLFSTISPVYDELNDKLSFGLHRVWKRMTAKWSGATRGDTVLDVCCGSGDIAFCLSDLVGPAGKVVGLDFSAAMLADAAMRERSNQRTLASPSSTVPMEWIEGDAMKLPFADASFDAATMGYGLRNVADIPTTLRELVRVLKPGATVAILDFNNSTDALVDGVQDWMLSNLVVPAAKERGVEAEYLYLRPSIKKFPTGKKLERLALNAGFNKALHYEIGFGMMGVLVATKSTNR